MWTQVLLLVLCACVTHTRNVGFPNGRVVKPSQCFGLARRTRTVNLDVPILYNTVTGHTSPIPKFLLEVDDGTIKKLEQDGWEVRERRVCVPQHFYERVPVCCPWDQTCQGDGNQGSMAPGVPGPCANGGQLIYDNGLRRCECPPGFKGLWCQIPDLNSKVRPSSSVPSGPLMRSRPVNPYQPMMTQADLWRRKQAMLEPMRPVGPTNSPLSAMYGPWAQQAAVWHQQLLMQLVAQWCQKQGLRAVPYELVRAVQAAGGNPYSVQGRIPPQFVQALSAVYQNPYHGAVSPNQMEILMNRLVGQPGMPSGTASPYGTPSRLPGNPYNVVRPYNDPTRDNPGRPGPAPRTPWDLDPFQKAPKITTSAMPRVPSERERQMMAMALYQQYLSQQRDRWNNDGMRRPDIPRPLPPVTGMELSRQFPAQTGMITPPQGNPYNSIPASQPPKRPDLLNDAPIPQMPNDAPMPLDDEMPQMPTDMPSRQMPNGAMPPMSNNGPMPPMLNGAPMPPMPNGAPMPGGPMPGGPMPGGPMPKPSPEEMAKIEACRVDLEPRMDVCLSVHQITMTQFMDPEYMATAKSVCQSSSSVGQCLMQLDNVCGEGDEQVLLTRKMINSVLQMMGMVCQQIMARGDTAMPPPPGMPNPPSIPQPEEMPHPPAMAPPTSVEEEYPPVLEEEPNQIEPSDELDAFVQPTEDSPTKFEEPTKVPEKSKPVPEKAASQSSDHGVAEPVQASARLWGYPLWMVIALLALLFALTLLAVLVVCLCLRRRRRQQKAIDLQKEIEKMPEPLDGAKLAAIGIPPPVYTTTIVNQTTEDELSLPPLDIPEEKESCKQEDEDADDESDEKEEVDEKKDKKKEKKENK